MVRKLFVLGFMIIFLSGCSLTATSEQSERNVSDGVYNNTASAGVQSAAASSMPPSLAFASAPAFSPASTPTLSLDSAIALRPDSASGDPPASALSASPVPETVVTQATLGAIGDVLIHKTVYQDAAKPDGTYNFAPMFDEIRPSMQAPDLLVANQESMIGGTEIGLSDYPTFNSPHEIGDSLEAAGVDVVTLANNHALDRGEKAIQSALAYWDKLNMTYVGAYKSQEDADRIRTLTRNGITFAFLAYAYGTNGIPVPPGKPYLVNLIDPVRIGADVQKAKDLADVVVVSMHWGIEYQPLPNDKQKQLAQQLADMGVDIVIGTHPHVLQPPAWVTGKNGNKTFVMYSLGNFLSAQDQVEQLLGGICTITVEKTTQGERKSIVLKNPVFLPTLNYYKDWRGFKIIPLNRVTDAQLPGVKAHEAEIKQHMASYIPDLVFAAP